MTERQDPGAMGAVTVLDPQSTGDSWAPSDAHTDPSSTDLTSAAMDALRAGLTAISVTSGPSTGKTALCHALAAGADERAFTASVTDPSIDPDALLLQLLTDFGLSAGAPPHGQAHDRETLRTAIVRFLKSLQPLGAHALLIIDDADQVGVDVYEVLLQLAQAAGTDESSLRLVLVGHPSLEARLSEPPLSEFPAAGSLWTQLGGPQRDIAALPPAESVPDLTAVTAVEPAARATRMPAISPPLLAVALLIVGLSGWWAMRGAAPESNPPAVTVPANNQPAAASDLPGAPGVSTSSASVAPAPSAAATSPNGGATPPNASPTTAGEAFRITVASFKTPARAQELASQLQRQQLVVTTRTDATNTWHQVVAGPYASIDAARDAQRKLERAGFADTQISLTASIR